MAEKSTEKTKKKSENQGVGGLSKAGLFLGMTGAVTAGILIALAVLIALGVYWLRGGFAPSATRVADKDKVDPSVAALMVPGPLPEMMLGSDNAPNTIVEYASMTCPHCAQFQTQVFPEVKSKYIDSGKVRYVFREFPLDGLALAASMLARCSGDKYFPMIDALFQTQATWAVPGPEGKQKLAQVAKQAGISQEEFDKCIADKDLFNKIVLIRQRGNEEFQVDSTPSFFVNGKRLKGEHRIEDFDVALGEASAPAKDDASKADGPASPAGPAPGQ